MKNKIKRFLSANTRTKLYYLTSFSLHRKLARNLLVKPKNWLVFQLAKINKQAIINDIEFIDIEDNDLVSFACIGKIDSSTYNNFSKDLREKVETNAVVLAAMKGNFKKDNKIFDLTSNVMKVYQNSHIKIAVLSGVYDKNRLLNKNKIIKQINIARHMEIDYILMYLDDKHTSDQTKIQKKLIRKLSNYGVDYTLAINSNDAFPKRFRKNLYKKAARSFPILGDLTNREINENIVLQLKFKKIDNNVHIFEESIIPILFNKKKGFELVDSNNAEVLRTLRAKEINIKPYFDNMTIGEMCEIIDIELPERLREYNNFVINRICNRLTDVEPGNVYFFRPFYSDSINTKVPSDQDRLHIVDKAMSKGAVFVISYQKLSEEIPHVFLGEASEAHIHMTAHLRNQLNVKTIGVTGSVGKTTTKDMLYEVVKQKFSAKRSLKNNNIQGIIDKNIQDIDKDIDVFVQELGEGKPGGASRHSRMIGPNMVVITNVGQAHIGLHGGSQNRLLNNILEITHGLQPSGIAYLNGDDPLLWNAELDCNVIYYAIDNKEADYYADDIKYHDNDIEFNIVCKATKEGAPFKIKIFGDYNILNAVACFAIGKELNMTNEQIAKGLLSFQTEGIRQNLVNIGGYNLILDCFNASITSVKSALDILTKTKKSQEGRRIAVLSDLTGMESPDETHEEVAKIVKEYADKLDYLICYGDKSRITYDNVKNTTDISCIYCTSSNNFKETLINLITREDIVLFKGSGKMELEERIDEIFGTNYSDNRYLSIGKARIRTQKDIRYKVFPNYAIVDEYLGENKVAKLVASINFIKVKNISSEAFNNSSLETFIGTRNLTYIGVEAFKDCFDLKDVKNILNVKFIDSGAFNNCKSLKQIRFGSNLLHIGDFAFEYCSNLKEVYLPPSVGFIGTNAFAGCDNITIACKKDSIAYQYAKANNINVKVK